MGQGQIERREAEGETGGEKEREASFRDQVCFASGADGCGVNGMWRSDVCVADGLMRA